MIQQQNCSNSIGFLILHFKRGNSNVSWDRWTLIALQHKRGSDSINIALCHAWIQNFFFRGVEVRHIFMFAGGYGPSHIFGNFIMQI